MISTIKKKGIIGLAVAAVAAVGMVFIPATANAQASNNQQSRIAQGTSFGGSLTSLIALEELFNGGVNGNTYTVQAGDTLSELANRFGTTVSAIANANNIENPDLIFTGETLTIPADSTTTGGTDNTLRDLIVIEGLFGSQNTRGNTTGTAFGGSLRDLIVLEELFNGGGNGILSRDRSNRGSSNMSNGTDNTLRDLIVIGGLFGNGTSGGTAFGGSLRDLIILEDLFNNGTSGSGNNLLNGTDSTLRDLILIESIFGNGSGSLF